MSTTAYRRVFHFRHSAQDQGGQAQLQSHSLPSERRRFATREAEDVAATRGVLTATILGMLVYTAIALALR